VRHYFDKFGGNLGATNSVLWQFNKCGILVIDKEDVDEEELMTVALDSGADDFDSEGEAFEITTSPEAFSDVRVALEKAGYSFITAEVTRVADNEVSLTDEKDLLKMQLLLDALEDDDDVQEVAHNWAE
jgi:transcriptional/translational regulatory protein YebC/TACO1